MRVKRAALLTSVDAAKMGVHFGEEALDFATLEVGFEDGRCRIRRRSLALPALNRGSEWRRARLPRQPRAMPRPMRLRRR
jgi:hypothetical protein